MNQVEVKPAVDVYVSPEENLTFGLLSAERYILCHLAYSLYKGYLSPSRYSEPCAAGNFDKQQLIDSVV
ncbi:hypothetical protein PENFLA_c001G08225 [Penicillium flavigenum]|uniref:Uncharacterized protein n=1 Tax=Penicillium flavigenum TaxID=254877 RepID=A0A1V6U2X7_9EURO|nr:hypothetical protein PENFLA_c001G08225 [Penicillium flavigenum]